MREMQEAIIENLAHYIQGATDAEFNLDQCKRMVRLVSQAYKCLYQSLNDLAGE